MPFVAIAGGTSIGLGRAITIGILNTRYADGESWTPLILSRSSQRPLWLQAVDPDSTRVELKVVDYSSEASLFDALRGVHTVISVALAKDGTQADMQITMARAAAEAGVRRFAPSDWADGPQGVEHVAMLKMLRAGVWEECDRLEREKGMRWARFSNGCFMNYLGVGTSDPADGPESNTDSLSEFRKGGGYMPGADDACAGVDEEGDMPDGKGGFLFSLSTALAELPEKEDGSPVRICLTELKDIGRFVAASLALPTWEKDMAMCGDIVTTSELLQLVEEVTRKSFQVERLPPSRLKRQLAATPDDQLLKRLWLELKLMYTGDEPFEGLVQGTVNKLCPNVKPITVREYLYKYWSDPTPGNRYELRSRQTA